MPAESTNVALSASATVIRSVPSTRLPPSVITWICDSNFMPLSASAPRMVSRPFATETCLSERGEEVRRVKETLPPWSAETLPTMTPPGSLAKYSRL